MSEAVEEPKAGAASEATPVFGAGSKLGAGTGFGGFTGAGFGGFSATPSEPKASADGEAGEEGDANPEAECQAEFKPVVQLEEVEVNTGEQDEETLIELKSKLYRFDTSSNEWKERGVGMVRLLRHKETGKTRLLMRQEKTLKIRANHIVMPGTKLQEHAGSDKAWVWSAVDFAEEEQKVELFCIRFGSVEKAQEFKKKFDEAVEDNSKIISASGVATAKAADDTEADELASGVEKVAVTES